MSFTRIAEKLLYIMSQTGQINIFYWLLKQLFHALNIPFAIFFTLGYEQKSPFWGNNEWYVTIV